MSEAEKVYKKGMTEEQLKEEILSGLDWPGLIKKILEWLIEQLAK